MRIIWAMTTAFTKSFFRNKIAIFFTFLLPISFLVIFGFIFGQDSVPNFEVGLVNQSKTSIASQSEQIIQSTGIINLQDGDDLEEFKTSLNRNEIDAIIVLPPEFGEIGDNDSPQGELELYGHGSNEQLNLTLAAILESIFDGLNQEIAPGFQPFTIKNQTLEGANLTPFDYVLSGLIGFSILSLGIFSMSQGFVQDKKSKALLRIKITPVRSWQFIMAIILNRTLVGVISVALLFIFGVLLFDFSMRGDYFNFLIFNILSIICLLGFGMAIAAWASNPDQAAPISNLIGFPMTFLSGVFFPVFLMPDWVQQISPFIPLTAVVDGLRLISTEGYTILDLGPQLLILLGWSIVLYTLSALTFRWE